MNPEPAITRMKERDLHTERNAETERQKEKKKEECVTCPVKTQYVEKNTLCIYVCGSLSRNINLYIYSVVVEGKKKTGIS